MIKKKKNLKYINSEFNFFFLEKEFKKNKLNRIYYLTLFLITYIKKISQLFKYKYIINLYLNQFFYKKIDLLQNKKRAFIYFNFFKQKKKNKKLINIFPFLFKQINYNLNSFIFFKVSSFYKIKSFIYLLNNDIKKNFFLFKFYILLNINQLISFIRVKRFNIFLLLLHFLFQVRKKGWKWKYYYSYTIKFIKRKKFKKFFLLITSSIEKKIMYFLYFKLKIKNQKFKFLNINSFILHLFLKTNYNLDFFDLKNFYYNMYHKWYISSLQDLIFLLERKLDILLSKFNYNINFNNVSNSVLVNNHYVNSDYIVSIGDFINVENSIIFNKWFFLFFFLKNINVNFLSFFFKNKLLNFFFYIFFEFQLYNISKTLIVYNSNFFFWSDICSFLLKSINLFYIFFYTERYNIFFFEFIIDNSFFYFYNIDSYFYFSNYFKHKFFIFISIYYILNFIDCDSFISIYFLKSFFFQLFFFKIEISFFLFSFFNNIYYHYSKLMLLISNNMYNVLNNYNFNSFIYSYYPNRYNTFLFETSDFYSLNFDTFFYSFINYKNKDYTLQNNFDTFKSIYTNNSFSFFFSIGSIFDYNIILNVTKLIKFNLIDSFNFNIYTDWVLNIYNIYLIYNIKKQLYLMKFNSFFVQKKIYSFLNINIENFF